jgi:hypothetical protein
MKVENDKQTSSAEFWMGCPPAPTEDPDINALPTDKSKYRYDEGIVVVDSNNNPAPKLCPPPINIFVLLCIYIVVINR